jgi:sugar O-acyltransferase (sialic acid O-acetyltransferase NeuD family)
MKVLVYGSRTFGQVVRNLVVDCGHEFAGFVDDRSTGPEILGRFTEVTRSHPAGEFACINAVGYRDLAARRAVTERIVSTGYVMPTLIHPRAYMGAESSTGVGNIVMAGALIDYRAKCGDAVVVWPGAVISHDSTIGGNTFLSPNCTICGCVTMGAHCFVGAGAVVVDHVHVPDGTRIKAGERYVGPA